MDCAFFSDEIVHDLDDEAVEFSQKQIKNESSRYATQLVALPKLPREATAIQRSRQQPYKICTT